MTETKLTLLCVHFAVIDSLVKGYYYFYTQPMSTNQGLIREIQRSFASGLIFLSWAAYIFSGWGSVCGAEVKPHSESIAAGFLLSQNLLECIQRGTKGISHL